MSQKPSAPGPAVVLVNWTAANGEQWAFAREPLSEFYTVITPDLAGSGRGTDPGGPLNVDDLARQVLAVTDAAHAESFALAGHRATVPRRDSDVPPPSVSMERVT